MPLSTQGLAGGEKYLFDSIFFKYAVDQQQLFGDDEYAMKVAGYVALCVALIDWVLLARVRILSCPLTYGCNQTRIQICSGCN